MADMTSRIFLAAGTAIILSLGFSSYVRAGGENVSTETTLCAVVRNPEVYEGRIVAMDIQAKAALHQFDVALTSPDCPLRNIFLKAGIQFLEDKAFMVFVRKLHPGFPDDDEYTDHLADAHVVGKIVRLENRDLLMTYLELQEITIRN
jgi:hypothetical protein